LGERLWGPNDPRVAKVLHNLSGIAYYREDFAEYERLLQRALAIREATLPADDLDLAGSREALALLRLKQGRPAEAAQLLERLEATYEKVYGPWHPQLPKTLLHLGAPPGAQSPPSPPPAPPPPSPRTKPPASFWSAPSPSPSGPWRPITRSTSGPSPHWPTSISRGNAAPKPGPSIRSS